MIRTPLHRSATVLGAILALMLLGLFVSRGHLLDAQGQGPEKQFVTAADFWRSRF